MPSSKTSYGVKFSGNIPLDKTLRLAAYSEGLGYASIRTAEPRLNPDSLTRIAAVAAVTKSVSLGSSVVNPFTRTPALIAISSAAIDGISGGRFVLGIGAGSQKLLESQGIKYERPLKRLEESARVMKMLWRGESVTFKGETLTLTNVKLDFKPYRADIPIWFGVTGHRGIELAKKVADGIIMNSYTSKDYASSVIEKVGRGRDFKVVANIMVGMDEDADLAVRQMKPQVFMYLTKFPQIAKVNNVSEKLVTELKEVEQSKGPQEAAKHVPDDLVRELAPTGTPEECRRWIADYCSVGIDEALITPIHGDPELTLKEMSPLISS